MFFYVNRWITDPEVDSRLSFFPYTVHCLVRPWIQNLRQSSENFTFFFVNRMITDPEVDSRLSFFPYTVHAWFDRRYKFCVSLRRISDFSTCLGGLGS